MQLYNGQSSGPVGEVYAPSTPSTLSSAQDMRSVALEP